MWEQRLSQIRRRPAQGLVLLLEEAAPRFRLAELGGVGLGDAGPVAVLDIGQLQPAVQAGLGAPEVFRDVADAGIALSVDRDDIATELKRGKAFGTVNSLPGEPKPSQVRSQANRQQPLSHSFGVPTMRTSRRDRVQRCG